MTPSSGAEVQRGEAGTDPTQAFHLEEFKALRAEIDARSAAERTVAQGTLAGMAALYGWLLVSPLGLPKTFLAILVPGLIILIKRRVTKSSSFNKEIGEYICSVEKKLRTQGWEHYVRDPRSKAYKEWDEGHAYR